MYDYIHYDSPLGTLTIAAEKDALIALVIEGQKYEELHLTGGGRERETPVLQASQSRRVEAFPERHRLSTARVAGAASDPLWPDGELWQSGRASRQFGPSGGQRRGT